MTLPIERARSRRPVTWLTLIGVLLLPVLIGGILVAALYNPTERLDTMTAAIVNEDEPVTVDGQYTPLGRQLAAGLVEGDDDIASNLTWVLSNADDAAAGLTDGSYQAAITIPENFSAAATSAGQSLTGTDTEPAQATITVTTPPDALIVDDAITAQVAQTAATTLGKTLSSLTLENVFLGFTTLGDQLGEAADGATALADGSRQAADGAAELPGGASALADGARGLSTGAGSLGTGLTTIAGATRDAAAGASALADGVDQGAAGLQAAGIVPDALTEGAGTAADTAAAADGYATTAAAQTAQLAADLGAMAAVCMTEGGSPAFCAQLADKATDAAGAATSAGTASAITAGAVQATAGVAQGITGLATAAPAQLAGQLREIATNVRALGSGLIELAGGVDQSAGGATQLASGASQLASGASELSTGAQALAEGFGEIATGTAALADGLHEASTALPAFSDAQAHNLAEVMSAPVAAEGAGTTLFGASAIPLLAMLALWFGGLASFIAMRAIPADALSSRRPSVLLALRALGPAAAIGAAQGVLVAGVVQLAASYDAGTWWAFAGLCALAGVAFAAVNQALVALFGGAGRWVSALVGVLAVASGIVSTVPGVLSSIAGLLPTAPAYHGMVGVLTSVGVGGAVAGLMIWGVLALAATTTVAALRRTVSARSLLQIAAA